MNLRAVYLFSTYVSCANGGLRGEWKEVDEKWSSDLCLCLGSDARRGKCEVTVGRKDRANRHLMKTA